mmetsp:Transcript_22346/g.38025  ORF Transcript_22346/g.38025 Transcript_22346/m.38025 type:complete len:105 (-) Transcript_22346:75-389(-)
MVKVWYEPPPFGPGTSLSRPPYGIATESSPLWLVRMSKAPQWQVVTGAVVFFSVISYLPLLNPKLPFTMSPEYQAAQRAYMRYHNMNPIYGISSKKARAADAGK